MSEYRRPLASLFFLEGRASSDERRAPIDVVGTRGKQRLETRRSRNQAEVKRCSLVVPARDGEEAIKAMARLFPRTNFRSCVEEREGLPSTTSELGDGICIVAWVVLWARRLRARSWRLR